MATPFMASSNSTLLIFENDQMLIKAVNV